jgi:hypothetical protein
LLAHCQSERFSGRKAFATRRQTRLDRLAGLGSHHAGLKNNDERKERLEPKHVPQD